MKRCWVVLVLGSLLMVIASCQTTSTRTVAQNPTQRHPLEGNWELVSGHFTNTQGQVTRFAAPDVRAIKVIGPTRFAFITTREDGTFVRAAGGRYTIEGNRYTEHVEQTSGAPAKGSYEFTWRIDGDQWYHAGKLPNGEIEEIWRRVS